MSKILINFMDVWFFCLIKKSKMSHIQIQIQIQLYFK